MKFLLNRYYRQHSWLYFLTPLAFLYRIIIAIRKRLYQKEFFTRTKVSVPVIIVGNITLGGTGKTPLVIALVEFLQNKGFSPGIVSRGYGGKAKNYPCLVTEQSAPHLVGDEPLLIYLRTRCPVVVDPNRVQAAQYVLKNFPCNIIISDDGLQHYALERDIEIAVIDGERRLGNGFCLPAGPLREPKQRLEEVSFIVCNGKARVDEFPMQLKPGCLHNAKTSQTIAVNDFPSKKIHAVAGIGNPQRFFQLLRELNFTVIEHAFSDHYRFSSADLRFAEDLPIIMTEKDAVKCQAFADSNYWYLPVTAELTEEFKALLLIRLAAVQG
jgi:tetraacyldisaccharide 4'-kinase